MMIDENRLLEEINKLPYTNGNYDKENANTGFINGVQTAYKLITNLIKEQPKVNEWIPVTEMLPEEQGTYIVTQQYRYKFYKIAMDLFMSDGTWGYDNVKHERKVVAWQPLPKPYKEKENVE